MDSGTGLLRVVTASIIAFHNAADTVAVIRDRKDKKKKKKREKEIEELCEIKILHKSLVEGETQCRQHYENGKRQHGYAFEAGDAHVLSTLKDVVITLQTEVIQILLLARAVETTRVDFSALFEVSISCRKDATKAMLELCRRIEAAMSYQQRPSEETYHDPGQRSGLTNNSSFAIKPLPTTDDAYAPVPARMDTPTEKSLPSLPSESQYDLESSGDSVQQTFAVHRQGPETVLQHPASLLPAFPKPPPLRPQGSSQQSEASVGLNPVSTPGRLALSVQTNLTRPAGHSPSLLNSDGGEEATMNYSMISAPDPSPLSISSIQPSPLAFYRQEESGQSSPDSATSLATCKAVEGLLMGAESIQYLSTDASLQLTEKKSQTISPPQSVVFIQDLKQPTDHYNAADSTIQESVHLSDTIQRRRSLQPDPLNTGALTTIQQQNQIAEPNNTSEPQSFAIDAGTCFETPPDSPLLKSSSPAIILPGTCRPSVVRAPSVTFPVRSKPSDNDLRYATMPNPSTRLTIDGTFQENPQRQFTEQDTGSFTPKPQRSYTEQDISDTISIISRETETENTQDFWLSPRIDKFDEHVRASRAPEAFENILDAQFTDKLRPVPDLENEKFSASLTQADYQERLSAVPKGLGNIWLPLSRPAMHNRYHGFCPGAWRIRKAADEGLQVHMTPALKEPIIHWQCVACNFRSKAPNADALPDYVLFNSKYNIRYRWIFLAKSHQHASQPCDTPDNYKYGCIFCAAQGQPSAPHEKLEYLFIHILSKHKTTMMTPETRQKTKCITGSVVDSLQDWDINIPETTSKSVAGTAAEEMLMSATKFWHRRRKAK